MEEMMGELMDEAGGDAGLPWVDQGDGMHRADVDVDGNGVADVAMITDGTHTLIGDGNEAVLVDNEGRVVAEGQPDGTLRPVVVEEAVAQPPVPPGLEDQTGNPFPDQPGLEPEPEPAVAEEPVVVEQSVIQQPVGDPVVEQPDVVQPAVVEPQIPDPVWFTQLDGERSGAEIAEDLDHWFQQTTNYTCGPASVVAIINDFGDAPVVSETGVSVYAAENDLLHREWGILPEGLAQTMTAHGVPAKVVGNGSWELVDELLDSGRAVVLGVDASQYWDVPEGAGPLGHAVRIVDVDLEAGVAVLSDPGVANGQGLVVSLDDLDRAWNFEVPINDSESATRVMVVTESVDSDAGEVVVAEQPPDVEPVPDVDAADTSVLDLDLSSAEPGQIVDLPEGGLARNGLVVMAAAVPAPLALLLRTLATRRRS